MRFELTTVTLARWGSTTELRSLMRVVIIVIASDFSRLITAKLAS